MTNIFTGKVFLLVTGASRGIGKQIAQTFGALLEGKSHVLLLSRNSELLKKSVDDMPEGVVASYKSIDFSQTSTRELKDVLLDSLKNEKPESFERAIVVHSAAMANFNQLTNEMTDLDEWHKSFNLNMFSPAVLNGIFMDVFKNQATKKYVVNISSYWGLKPDVYVGSYCAAKAAKDMFFKVFALENPDVQVLNYLPGFVGTDMFHDVLKVSKNEELKKKISQMVADKSFVTPEQTVQYLVEVLKKQEYKSGDHVDYYNKKN
ncbi:sepiapterin reductase [Nasonia vitripennis]|uniref:Sepiapterin reductase n=1 Tax=Nasonia vitripennis TaxID=7425 RepID=A0A7M7ITD1_NASVI|nr:sepiapterin reductase [Nasonia vitripennis]XP_031789533.1 sepiapterin reductase [Nasonia vitripennis]XP_031789534.1 sepiapterin reductase [Nasonia vitripennis]